VFTSCILVILTISRAIIQSFISGSGRSLKRILLMYKFSKYRIRNGCSIVIKAKQEAGHFVVVVVGQS